MAQPGGGAFGAGFARGEAGPRRARAEGAWRASGRGQRAPRADSVSGRRRRRFRVNTAGGGRPPPPRRPLLTMAGRGAFPLSPLPPSAAPPPPGPGPAILRGPSPAPAAAAAAAPPGYRPMGPAAAQYQVRRPRDGKRGGGVRGKGGGGGPLSAPGPPPGVEGAVEAVGAFPGA